jgi:hypothetical protein
MNHPSEEQLVDHYYGDADSVGEHLKSCTACAAEFEKIRLTLASVSEFRAPEPRATFEAELWSAIRPSIQRKKPIPLVRTFALVGTIAAMLVIAFVAGRVSKPVTTQVAQERIPVLVVAVGDHMERLEAVFQELENASPSNGRVDISFEQSSAEDLLESNRLYRQSALATGDLQTASVLEDMELTLLDIAHQPDTISAKQLTELRNQISDRGVLFKARVLASRLRVEQTPHKESKETKL